MNKIILSVALASVVVAALAGCDTQPEYTAANPKPISETDQTEVFYQLPDGRFIECFESGYGKNATATCHLNNKEPTEYSPATEKYDVSYVENSSKGGFVCLSDGYNATMVFSCVEGKLR